MRSKNQSNGGEMQTSLIGELWSGIKSFGFSRTVFLLFLFSLILFQGVILKQDFYFISIVFYVLALFGIKKSLIIPRGISIILTLLVLPGLISIATCINPGEALFGLMKLIFLAFLILYLQQIFRKSGKEDTGFMDLAFLGIFASGILAAAVNFISYFFYGLNVQGIVRFSAMIPYANLLAAYMFICSLIGLSFILRGDIGISNKLLVSIGIIVLNAAMLMTQSRSMLVISCFSTWFSC